MTTPHIRHITEDDWAAITALEEGAYSGLGLSEGPAPLRAKAAASPQTCFVLDLAGRIAGYAVALPYPPFQCPELADTAVHTVRSHNLHLHDLTIAADSRLRGLAKRLLHHLRATATRLQYTRISLVAVGDSEPMWSAQGFHAHRAVALPDGYGAGAVYMSQPLDDRTG